eukprot:932890_1
MDDIVVSHSLDSFLHSKSWYYIKNINHIIGGTIITTILCIEVYSVIKAFKSIDFYDENTKTQILKLVFPLCIYIGNICSIFCGPMSDFAPNTLSCLLWCQIAIVLWLTNKCLIYLLLIIRIHIIYDNTTFKYPANLLSLFCAIIIIETLIMATLAPLNTSVQIIEFSDINGVICEMTVSFLFLGCATAFDMIHRGSIKVFDLYDMAFAYPP